MNTNTIMTAALCLPLLACSEAQEPAPVVAEKLTSYKALGTEPGWTVTVEGDQISHVSQSGDNDFAMPIQRMTKTATGWEIKGFSDVENINLSIRSGIECNDGMSDRVYADTVEIGVSGGGVFQGCGGDILSDPDAP